MQLQKVLPIRWCGASHNGRRIADSVHDSVVALRTSGRLSAYSVMVERIGLCDQRSNSDALGALPAVGGWVGIADRQYCCDNSQGKASVNRQFISLICLGVTLGLSGCTYALQPYNTAGPEKLQIISARTGLYAIRIDGHGDTPVGPDGRVVVAVPVLPRGCSPYLFGLIKIGDGSPERLKAIHVLRDGRVFRHLSLREIRDLPMSPDGYRLVKL